jgi:hypothetical protein
VATFRVALICEQGIDLIIIPLDGRFGSRPEAEQKATMRAFQSCADSAGLAGTVVPVWETSSGWAFIAPPSWHPFLRTFDLSDVELNINTELTCGGY